MALEEDFLKQLVATFRTELQEKLQSITDGLFALEKNKKSVKSKKIIEEIFRAAHNIKGSARSVGVLTVGEIAHEIESLFASIQSQKRTINSDRINLCLLAVDAMRSAMDSFSENKPLAFDLEELISSLKQGKPLKIKEFPKVSPEVLESSKSHHEASEFESIRVSLSQIEHVSALVEQMQINKIAMEEHFKHLRKITSTIRPLMHLNLHEAAAQSFAQTKYALEHLTKAMRNTINELNVTDNALQEEVRRLR